MNGHEKNSHTTIRLKRRLGWVNAPNYYVEIKRSMPSRHPWAGRCQIQYAWHAKTGFKINSPGILAQITRPTRIHSHVRWR